MLLKHEEIVHLLGTIFSGGLIHIYSSEYLSQQDGVRGIESKNYSVCVHGDEGTCHPVQQCGS